MYGLKRYELRDEEISHLEQCVVDLDEENVHAMFIDVEDAESYIEWYTELNIHGDQAPNLSICHIDQLVDYLSIYRKE